MSKTLIFCTSYADTEYAWSKRYRLWLNAIQNSEIEHSHVLLIDDGSPVTPRWQDTLITNNLTADISKRGITLFRFSVRLGRQARTVYPGWYRSFTQAARFAQAHDFDKVVHVESDAFIISKAMQHYFNSMNDGWIAPSIQSHQMPESAIQIMAGKGLDAFIEFSNTPYSDIVGIEAENIIPFTRVEKGFIGSRYGETMNYVPEDADFVTQTHPEMRCVPEYYWWLPPDAFIR